MAAKRLLDESSSDPDCPTEKRMRTTPSFTTVIREAVMMKSLQNFCSSLEPLLRKVVKEEVERGVTCVTRPVYLRSPSMRIQAVEDSSLQLVFSKKLSLPVFTGSKIEDEENNPLQVLLIDNNGGQRVQTDHPVPIRIEIVVLNGDFPNGDGEEWTSDEFENNILKEREGKRPLLAGELQFTMREGVALIGEIEFTDNSSWIRSRRFRLGARIVQGTSQGRRIKEAKTESFPVRDHRGELYKKHYPPALGDEVWRLEKIGKDGAFHKKLASAGIKTVQDFLKLSVVDSTTLRKILGGGMSDKMWEVTLKHAQTCDIGNKRYLHRDPHVTIIVNAICQVVGVVHDGQTYPTRVLSEYPRGYVEQLVGDAYRLWNSLEEVNGAYNENALLTYNPMSQGIDESNYNILQSNHQSGLLNVGHVEETSLPAHNLLGGYNGWHQHVSGVSTTIEDNYAYNSSDLTSEDDESNSQTRFN